MNDSSNLSATIGEKNLLPFCERQGVICLVQRWYVGIVLGINIISVLANAGHFVVLHRLAKTSQQTFMKLLKVTTVLDGLFAVCMMLHLNCTLRKLMVNSYTVATAVRFMRSCVSLNQFAILGMVSFDRWLAIAHPYSYDSSFFNRHPEVLVMGVMLVICVLVLARDLGFQEGMCFDEVHGVKNCSSPLGIITCGILPFMFFLVNLVLIQLLLWELRKMKRRRTRTESDMLLNKVTRATIAISLLYFGCFFWHPIMQAFQSLSNEEFIYGCDLASYAAFSLYGYVNILLYGLINKSYRNELMSMLPMRKKNTSVSPEN